IRCSRQTCVLLSGNLENNINTYPPFPGKEKHLLRAQIARISAATHISPADFFQPNEDGEEAIANPEYEPLSPSELADSSLENWVHHSMFILPQGRTKSAPALKPESSSHGEDEEEDEEEEEEEEVGPPLLHPIAEDDDLDDGTPAWCVKQSPNGTVLVSSNYWPGAYAIATEERWWNVYIGWGQKQLSGEAYRPINLHPPVADQFDDSEEACREVDDPSHEEEEAWLAAHAELNADVADDENGDGSEESEEEDDEDDR
ncbi:unnamed protein product, partial [Mesocestoides corti]